MKNGEKREGWDCEMEDGKERSDAPDLRNDRENQFSFVCFSI